MIGGPGFAAAVFARDILIVLLFVAGVLISFFGGAILIWRLLTMLFGGVA